MADDYGYIPESVINEIADKTDIVSLINRYVALKQSGANYMGLCPFHSERTPSFSVSPSKQIFHCFGCGKGGNAFKFLMEIENLTFPEAAVELARLSGVTIPQKARSQDELKRDKLRNTYFEINELVKDFYYKNLISRKSDVSSRYLADRAISQKSIEQFQLGATLPNSWDSLYSYLKNHGVSEQDMVTLGLISERRDKSGYIDRFRDRVMFPIINESGKTIGFGGRTLEKKPKMQKYLNSPETPIFRKSDMLYGLYQGKKAIRQEDSVTLVEGYLDVIQIAQHGIENVVAPLGTALTKEQIKKLMRQTYHFNILFDGDSAGINASKRAYELIRTEGANGRVVALPDNMDPDDFVKQYGAESLKNLIKAAKNGIIFTLEQAIVSNGNERFEQKLENLYQILPLLTKIKSRAEFEAVIENISEKLELSNHAVIDELNRYKKSGKRQQVPDIDVLPKQDIGEFELLKKKIESSFLLKKQGYLLNALLCDSKFIEDIERYGGDILFDEIYRCLYRSIKEKIQLGEQISGRSTFSQDNELYLYIYTELLHEKLNDDIFYKLLHDVVNAYLDNEYNRVNQALNSVATLENPDEMKMYLSELNFILEQKKMLK